MQRGAFTSSAHTISGASLCYSKQDISIRLKTSIFANMLSSISCFVLLLQQEAVTKELSFLEESCLLFPWCYWPSNILLRIPVPQQRPSQRKPAIKLLSRTETHEAFYVRESNSRIHFLWWTPTFWIKETFVNLQENVKEYSDLPFVSSLFIISYFCIYVLRGWQPTCFGTEGTLCKTEYIK